MCFFANSQKGYPYYRRTFLIWEASAKQLLYLLLDYRIYSLYFRGFLLSGMLVSEQRLKLILHIVGRQAQQ